MDYKKKKKTQWRTQKRGPWVKHTDGQMYSQHKWPPSSTNPIYRKGGTHAPCQKYCREVMHWNLDLTVEDKGNAVGEFTDQHFV